MSNFFYALFVAIAFPSLGLASLSNPFQHEIDFARSSAEKIENDAALSSRYIEASEELEKLGELITSEKYPAVIEKSPLIPKIITTARLLLVTHATKEWDEYLVGKRGVDKIIEEFLADSDSTIIFLKDNFTKDPAKDVFWYTTLRKPDFVLYSYSGEFKAIIKSNNITVIGGFFGACHYQSTRDVIRFHASDSPLIIHFPLSAIYIGVPYGALDRFYSALRDDSKFLKYILEKLSYKPESHRLFSSSNNGGFDLERGYTFQIFRDGKLLKQLGLGKKLVQIRITSPVY